VLHGQCKKVKLIDSINGIEKEFSSCNEAALYEGITSKAMSYRLTRGVITDGRHYFYNEVSVNENYFKMWSSSMAYILGEFVADGSLKKQNYKVKSGEVRHRYYVRFASVDLELIEFIKTELESKHKIQDSNSKNRNTLYQLEIGSKCMFDSLVDLGINIGKSREDIRINIPDEYEIDFWRGYIDGDGSITNDRESLRILVYFTSFNVLLINQYKRFLEKRGMGYSETKFIHKNGIVPLVVVTVLKKDVVKLGRILYDNELFSIERKRKRVMNYVRTGLLRS
jgi:hypothetical protein